MSQNLTQPEEIDLALMEMSGASMMLDAMVNEMQVVNKLIGDAHTPEIGLQFRFRNHDRNG